MDNMTLQKIINDHPMAFYQYLKRHHLDFFNEMLINYPIGKFSEKIYRYLHRDDPDCGKCYRCDNPTTFINMALGFSKSCSYQCHHSNRSDIANEERNCVICGAAFRVYKKREKTTCSPECLLELNRSDEVNEKRMKSVKATNLEKYGVEHSWQAECVKDKIKATNLERYGCEITYQNKDIQKKGEETKLKKYGNKHYTNIEKMKQTCLIKYGVDNYGKTKEYKEKFAKTNLERYGVVYPIQLKDIFNKANASQNRALYPIKDYTTIFDDIVQYQSKRELKFIKDCEAKNIRVINGDTISYSLNGTSHKYFVDFKIYEPTGIRLVEIKSRHKWWFRDLKSGMIKAKANAAIQYSKQNGFLPFKILLS